MQQAIEKYKVVRRAQNWCVRVKGVINTTDSRHWCRERKMSYRVKVNPFLPVNGPWTGYTRPWDYDFIFDKEYEATAFILGYL